MFGLNIGFLSVNYKKSIMDYAKLVLWNYDLEYNQWLVHSRRMFEDFSLEYVGLDYQVMIITMLEESDDWRTEVAFRI